MKALYRGLTVAALASAGLIIVVTFLLFWGAPEMQIQGKVFGVGNLLMCSLTGLVITAALVWGSFAPLAATAVYALAAWYGVKQLGGMSGDVSGFALTLAELGGAAALVLWR